MTYQPIDSLKNNSKNKDNSVITEKKFYFEVLATDTTGKVFIKTEESFCFNLLSNNVLWSKAEIKTDNYIIDKEKGIRLHVKKTNTQNNSSEDKIRQVYVVTVD
jgi:hypothetical protein